jgi:ribosomal protein L28
MHCELTIKKTLVGNKVGRTRNNVSGRTKRTFDPNLHNTSFTTKELGNFTLKIAAHTKKNIDKYGDIITFLLNVSENQLSLYGLSLKNRINKHYRKIQINNNKKDFINI